MFVFCVRHYYRKKKTLKRNSFPPFLIDKIFDKLIDKVHSNSDQSNPESDKTRFYKLPYTGKYSEEVQKKLPKICKQFCKDAHLKILFTSFKRNNYFSTKDKTLYFLKSFLVYKFVCVRCNSCFIGETCRRLKTRIHEHVKKNENLIYINIHTTMKSVFQVLIQIVFLF